MYELVNTSLPNGLIAGTHGFATVAMTKGMPDSLRMRVEAYCAYSHRSSAHDATYFDENPVNWFHAILPQGEHIVGRVAPAEFDYTGRTNRLARLFVFSKGKMPLIGGVAVLVKKARRLQEPWSGEARWLDEDTESERLFRNEPVAATKDAPSWRKKFGDYEGLNYARGFARLLAKNVNGGGKPIYFKTSAAYDVSGGELLSLFADLINLLPTSVRTSVAFSTYSATLPQGAVCHLRGVYDRDRAFDMAKVTQPWVDCEASTVHNASMLPEEEIEPEKPMLKSSGGKVVSAEYRQRKAQCKGINLHLLERDKERNPFIIVILIAIAIVIVGLAIGIYMCQENERKKEESGAKEAMETDRINKENEKRVQEEKQRKEEIEREERQRKVAAEEAAKREKEETERKNRAAAEKKASEAEQKRKAAEEADRATAALRARELRLRHEQDAVVFTNAVKIVQRRRIEFEEAFDRNEKDRLTNGMLRVFYYDASGVLTNQLTGFGYQRVAKKHIIPTAPKESYGPCILWYDISKKVLYWDWSPLDSVAPQWFSVAHEKDLKKDCFGGNDAVFNTWNNLNGSPKFVIETSHQEDGNIFGDNLFWERKWVNSCCFIITTNMVISIEMFEPSPKKKVVAAQITNQIESVKNGQDELSKRKKELEDFKSKCEVFNGLADQWKELKSTIRSIKEKINGFKKGKVKESKGNTEAIANGELTRKNKEVKSVENQMRGMSTNELVTLKGLLPKGSIPEDKIKECEGKLKKILEALEKEIGKLNDKKKSPSESSVKSAAGVGVGGWEEKIRQSKFKVIEVEGGKR